MSFFSKAFRKEKKYKNKKDIKSISALFNAIKELESKKIIVYNEKDNRVFIESFLAYYFIHLGDGRFKDFIRNVYLYHSYNNIQKAWDEAINKYLNVKVRDAVDRGEVIDEVKLEKLRLYAQESLKEEDVKFVPMQCLEFFIVQSDLGSDDVVWAGTYNVETEIINIASWEQIQRSLIHNKEKNIRVHE